MPDQEPKKPENEAQEQEKPSGGGLKKAWKVLVVVAVLMLAEGAAFFVIMPGMAASQTDAADKIDAAGKKIDEQTAAKQDDQPEIEVGKFAVTNNVAAPDAALQIHFLLHVECAKEHGEELTKRLEQSQARVRQAVEVVARQATYKDIADPALDLMQRQMCKKLNEALGGETITRVIITGFRHFEQ